MSFDAAEILFLQSGQVAVAISSGSFGCHLGIVYSLNGKEAFLVHLAWHKSLCVENFKINGPNDSDGEGATWLTQIVPLPIEVSGQIAALIHTLGDRYNDESNGGVDYGINFFLSCGAISSDGIYKLLPGGDGLTCSTFISSIFETFQLPLVEANTWEDSESNRAWGRAVVCFMEQSDKINQDHINAVKKNINGIRLRPEEVAAAAESFIPGQPSKFSDLQERANLIAKTVERECGLIEFKHPGYHRCQMEYFSELSKIE